MWGGGVKMALSISIRGSTGQLSFGVHRTFSYIYRSRQHTSSLFAPARHGYSSSSSNAQEPAAHKVKTEFHNGSLNLTELESVVNRAARKKAIVKCKAVVRVAPADTRSFPFAEKDFAALKLSSLLLQRLRQERLEVPTDVQVAAIPTILGGHDAALQSYTGSGKTLAYLLPILSKVGPLRELQGEDTVTEDTINRDGVEAVIVVPSRELAMQIVREAERILGPKYKKVVQQIIGGANQSRQEEALKRNKPCIVVGTPGRISEISKAGKLHTHGCRFLVLDEADQLLSIKFRGDMRRILEHVGQRRNIADVAVNDDEFGDSEPSSSTSPPKKKGGTKVERQTVLVSATMPSAVLRAAAVWGHRPLLVRATSIIEVENYKPGSPSNGETPKEVAASIAPDLQGARESMPPNLEHFYVIAPVRHHVDILRKCIHALEAKSVIVFLNHSRRLKDVEFKLQARGLSAGSLHGDLNKMERANILTSFRTGKLRILATSEVGARGLDIPNCDLVVNLELPTDGSHYAHRGGRTGRLGRKGTVISVCEAREEFVLGKFERQLGVSIPRREVLEGQVVKYVSDSSKRNAQLTTS